MLTCAGSTWPCAPVKASTACFADSPSEPSATPSVAASAISAAQRPAKARTRMTGRWPGKGATGACQNAASSSMKGSLVDGVAVTGSAGRKLACCVTHRWLSTRREITFAASSSALRVIAGALSGGVMSMLWRHPAAGDEVAGFQTEKAQRKAHAGLHDISGHGTTPVLDDPQPGRGRGAEATPEAIQTQLDPRRPARTCGRLRCNRQSCQAGSRNGLQWQHQRPAAVRDDAGPRVMPELCGPLVYRQHAPGCSGRRLRAWRQGIPWRGAGRAQGIVPGGALAQGNEVRACVRRGLPVDAIGFAAVVQVPGECLLERPALEVRKTFEFLP